MLNFLRLCVIYAYFTILIRACCYDLLVHQGAIGHRYDRPLLLRGTSRHSKGIEAHERHKQPPPDSSDNFYAFVNSMSTMSMLCLCH